MKQFTLPPNFPTPRKKSVIIKQTIQGTLTTESGIELLESAANTQRPNVGVIFAVGADVLDDLKPGLKVYYNQYADLEISIGGLPYFLMHDDDVRCILEEENYVKPQTKTEKEVRLSKKIPQQDARFVRQNIKKANDHDKRQEITKKLIKKSPKNK